MYFEYVGINPLIFTFIPLGCLLWYCVRKYIKELHNSGKVME